MELKSVRVTTTLYVETDLMLWEPRKQGLSYFM